MDRLTRLAGVRAAVAEVAPGAPALAGITGARTPSGVPVAEPVKPVQNPPRSAATSTGAAGRRAASVRRPRRAA